MRLSRVVAAAKVPFFTSPRLRGEVGFYAQRKMRVRGSFRESHSHYLLGESPSSRPSPRARGEGDKAPSSRSVARSISNPLWLCLYLTCSRRVGRLQPRTQE